MQPEKYFTQTEVLERGWTKGLLKKFLPEPDKKGHKAYGGRGESYLFLARKVKAIEATEDFQRELARLKPKPTEVDLLAAIFTVNRTAKRYRDSSQASYRRRLHGLAGHASGQKEALYELKDRGVARAWEEGRISFCGLHAGLAVYRGEGYIFHSTVIPREEHVKETRTVSDKYLMVESKPRGKGERRLLDAEYTLQQLSPPNEKLFDRLEAPRHPRDRHPNWAGVGDGDDEADLDEADLDS